MPPPAFAGYTTSLTCGVWVGLDKPATIIPKGYGAALALPVWVDVMKRASPEKYPTDPLSGSGVPRKAITVQQKSDPAPNSAASDDGGLRKPEQKSGGILRSFRKFFGGQ